MPRVPTCATSPVVTNPRTGAARSKRAARVNAIAWVTSWATGPEPGRADRSPRSCSTAGYGASVATSGFQRTRLCSKMPAATGRHWAACRSTSSRSANGSLGSRSGCARASCSSPILPCARAAATRPGSTRSSTGLAKTSRASSFSTKPMPWPMPQAAKAHAARSRAPNRESPGCGYKTSCRAPACSMPQLPVPPMSTTLPMRPGLACGGRRPLLRTARPSLSTSATAALPRWSWSPGT